MYESSYHYLLMSNHLSLQKKIMAVLKPLGLSTGQPKVLDHLRYHNGASQKRHCPCLSYRTCFFDFYFKSNGKTAYDRA